MSRTGQAVAVLALVAVPALVARCGGDGAAPPPASSSSVPGKDLDPELVRRQQQVVDDSNKEADTVARGLLTSCEARVYDPRRDSLLDRTEGTVEVTTSIGKGTYRFVLDPSMPADRPLEFETVTEPPGAGPRTLSEVRNWAHLSCLGAFPVVAYYRPPIPLQVAPTNDRKNLIVIAPIFRSPLSVSYSFDERQVIVARAEWSDDKHRFATTYDWDPFGGGRYLLRRAVLYEGATTEFEYGDHDGVRLLDRVHFKDREHPIEAVFTYTVLRRRTR